MLKSGTTISRAALCVSLGAATLLPSVPATFRKGFHEHSRCSFMNIPSLLFVEVAGIEPASSGISMGILRAQPVEDCRGRHCYRHLCRPVPDEDVPDDRSVQPFR